MKYGFCPIIKAISILVVGIAFLLSGCHKRMVVEITPEKEEIPDYFDLAEQDLLAGNYAKAIEAYELYLKQRPEGEKSRMALYRIAKIHYNNDLYDKALPLFYRIAREYPGHPELPVVKYDIASIQYRLGEYERSKIEASEWLRRYPDNPLKGDVLFLMGKNCIALRDNPKAFYWLLKAGEESHASSDMQGDITDRIMGLIKNSPIKELNEMAKWAPGTDYAPHIYYRMASIYLNENRLDEAKYAVMALVRSTPEQTWVSIGRHLLERIEEELSVKEGVIGCLLPLSGPFTIYGQEALNGIQLGMGIFNRSEGDSELELIIKDTKGKVEETVLGVEELVHKDKVTAIIGPLASKPALAAAKKAQQLGIPIITLTQREGITDQGEMVFRNFLTPSKEIQRLLDKAVNEMGLKRFAVFYPDNLYGRFFMNLFWDKAEEMGGMITAVESYKPDETDFAVQIKKMVGLHYPRPESAVEMLKKEEDLGSENEGEDEPDSEEEPEPIIDFDAVFIPDNHQQVALIAPQFPFYNIFNVRLLGTSLWQSSELIEVADDYVQGAIFPSGFFAESDSDRVKEFVALYRENFGSEPGILAANGYDTIRTLRNILDKGGIKTKKDFQKRLSELDNFYGVTGKISFDNQGEVEKGPLLLTISGKHLLILP